MSRLDELATVSDGQLGVLAALAATLLLTPVVRRLAPRIGMVTRPRADRWAKKPTALLGGVAVFGGFAAALPLLPAAGDWGLVLGASGLLFLVGLVDDLRPLKPYQKLVGQIAGAAVLIGGGLMLPWTPWPVANAAVTLVWLIGITNAVNLLDNMDGLAAGVSGVAAASIAASFLAAGAAADAWLVAAFAAALAGFLWYNFNPASIFMGDCGSLFIGFFLAAAALVNATHGKSAGLVPVLSAPVLVLLIPIFDTTLVTVLRKLAGRRVSVGGRDHSSHRLVALGLSEKRAVLLLYALAAAGGLMANLVRHMSPDTYLPAVAVFVVGLTLLGIHLAGVKVYPEGAVAQRPVTAFLVNVSYKRRVFEVLLDVVLITVAYYTAHRLKFGPLADTPLLAQLAETLPVVVVLKLAAFLGFGVYRGLWRYVSSADLVVYAKAVAAGSVACVLAFLVAYRFQGLSRVVFALDALLLFVLLAGSRAAFLLLRRVLPPAQAGGRRALIFGAGDAGEMLLREMRNNTALGCLPVGFADDDPLKVGKTIHGLRVFGGNGSLAEACRASGAEVVYISTDKVPDDRVREIRTVCADLGAGLVRLRMSYETIDEGRLGDLG